MEQERNGLSFVINLGKWAGTYLYLSTRSVRLCLGFLAISIYFFDFESKAFAAMNKESKVEAEVQNV